MSGRRPPGEPPVKDEDKPSLIDKAKTVLKNAIRSSAESGAETVKGTGGYKAHIRDRVNRLKEAGDTTTTPKPKPKPTDLNKSEFRYDKLGT
jgi:hypothetical protein